MTELWSYRPELEFPERDLVGFDVEATDGQIGKVDESTSEVGGQFLVVDTGFWIFGKKRVIPARAVKQIDVGEEKVFIDLTTDQVKDAPDHDESWRADDGRRDEMTDYYQPIGF